MLQNEIDAWVTELENNSSEIYELVGNYLNLESELNSLKEKVERYEKALKEIAKNEYIDEWYIATAALNKKQATFE